MKRILLAIAVLANGIAYAQKADAVIDAKEVSRIENVLASDSMQGRQAGTAGINKAAAFIADEFKKAGLQSLQGNSYLQNFVMLRPKFISVSGTVNNQEADAKNIMVITTKPDLKVTEKSGYELDTIAAGKNMFLEAYTIIKAAKNSLVLVDESYADKFAGLARLKRASFPTDASQVFLLSNTKPEQFSIEAKHEITEMPLANVVGILPGKSKKNEYVIFSGHYDHLGIGKPVNGDSIYNGANDDAAGTTAVIMLANYFKALHNNERTIIFAAFTAEEEGGFGSQYFSRQLNPAQVVAMFNIEMIGTESKWGKNSAYITGFDKTNMGKILQQNLQGSSFTFYPDPYTDQNLFYRSDNATLARQGVPAHTISTSKMDNEPNYHKPSDEVSTLDMENMAQIIKAIAVSSKTIVAGTDTPSRVATASLQY